MALACSHRICTSHKDTRLGLPEVKLGLLPGCGGTVRLPRLIGLQSALEMILQGNSLDAHRALKIGLVDAVLDTSDRSLFFAHAVRYALAIPIDSFDNESKYNRRGFAWKDALLQSNFVGRYVIDRLTRNTLDRTTRKKYPAPYVILDSVMREFTCTSLQEACDIEAEAFGRLVVTPEAKNLMGLFQMVEETKRMEKYCQREKAVEPNKIAVIGAGMMGSGIAQFSLYKGYEVYLKDIQEQFVEKGLRAVERLFQNLVDREKMKDEDKRHLMNNISAGVTYEPIANIKVVLEAAVEVLAIKQQIVAEVERINPDAIIASNTSSLPISDIAGQAMRKENVIGMHFFAPVHRMPLVEIVMSSYTSKVALATIYKLALQLGKVPIVVRDGPGFFTTRMFACFTMEAARIALDGYSFEHLDELLIRDWMPMGAFRVMDESGLDVAVHVLPILSKTLDIDLDSSIANIIREMVAIGAIGRKTGRGFYVYDDRGKKQGINQDAIRVFHKHRPVGNPSITARDAIDRCIYLMINEASRCIEESIVSQPEDVDLGMVLGFGFAPHTGGLLHYADSIGLRKVCARLDELSILYGQRFRPSVKLLSMSRSGHLFFRRPKPTQRIDVDNLHCESTSKL